MKTANGDAARATSTWRTALLYSFVAILTVLVLATLYTHEAYVLNSADPEWAHLKPMRWWLLPHIAFAVVALLLGPVQFSRSLRCWSLTAHRWLGRTYVVAVSIASLLSVYIVLNFEASWNRWVMGTMGALWLVATILAWSAARNHDLAQHGLWMGRSYGLTFTFVTTRFLPDLVFPGMDYIETTALYWGLIVGALLLPDLLINGKSLLPWGANSQKSRRN